MHHHLPAAWIQCRGKDLLICLQWVYIKNIIFLPSGNHRIQLWPVFI